jgi:protein-S-isoprenylcysteine O-methyltransferase Ste14
MDNIQIIVFALTSLAIAAFSWFISIKHGRYHGIARFFSFESIALMTILDLKCWFDDPFSPMQVISWIFLFASIYVAAAGFMLLVKMGKPKKNIVEFEDTTKLVTTGMYKYIRHPLYASLVILGLGVFFKKIQTAQIILVIVNTLALYITARMEELEMMKGFGDEYGRYMKISKMFIPYIF